MKNRRFAKYGSFVLAIGMAMQPSVVYPVGAPVSELDRIPAAKVGNEKIGTQTWSKSLGKQETKNPNASYLSDKEHGLHRKTLKDTLWEPKETYEVEQRYQDTNRDYEMRSQYGLTTHEDDRGFMDRMRGFGNWIMTKMFRRQVEKGLESGKKNSSSVRGVVNAQKSIEAVVKPSLSVGSSEESSFQFKMGTKADLPGQKGTLWMQSDLVDGAVDVQVGNPWAIDPASLSSATERDRENYRLSLSRGLPIWDLRTSVSYGGSTTIMTTSVSKDLFDNMKLQFANRRGANLQRSGLPDSGENVVELLYGLKF